MENQNNYNGGKKNHHGGEKHPKTIKGMNDILSSSIFSHVENAAQQGSVFKAEVSMGDETIRCHYDPTAEGDKEEIQLSFSRPNKKRFK